MARLLVIASVVWPVWLGADVWRRSESAPGAGSLVLHAVASRICHQRSERSFHTHGAQWAVCARCAGLYFAAPIGAVLALRSRRVGRRRVWTVLAIAAAPTAAAMVVEWGVGIDPGNGWRAVAALPLGAAVASVVVQAARGGVSDRID
jgi:uncharacterized membrane protein